VSGLSSGVLFEWADLNEGVAVATVLCVGMRATGTLLVNRNDDVAIHCTSPFDALRMLSYLQVNVEP
jgi:hypothetical protein